MILNKRENKLNKLRYNIFPKIYMQHSSSSSSRGGSRGQYLVTTVARYPISGAQLAN